MIDFPLHTALGITLIGLYSISVLGLVLVVLLENRNPLKTIPWIIVLLMLPGVGLIFYVVFGQDNRRRRIISRRTYRRIMRPLRADAPRQDKCVVPSTYRPLMNMLNRNGRTPLLYGSRIDIYTRGEDKFDAFLEALRGARHHIHLQYYIFADDEIGRCVRQVLIERARAGVEVRVLYDDVGCWNVPRRFFDEMRREGIEVYTFLRVVFPLLTSKVNYRNHRKVAVIDGRTGFMGGMNIADRYVRGTGWGVWRDTHFRIEGKGVHGLQSAFLIDWYVVSRQLVKGKAYYPNEEFFDELLHILRLGADRHDALIEDVLVLAPPAREQIGGAEDDRERCTQLVRCVGDEALLLRESLLQTIQHAVERARQLGELVTRTRHVETPPEPFYLDAARRPCDLADRCEDAAADEMPREECEHEADGDRVEEQSLE